MTHDIIRRGRLSALDDLAARFISSRATDEWLFRYDILVDIAHVTMLKQQSIITQTRHETLVAALGLIYMRGYSALPRKADDVHVAIETALIDDVGSEHGGWLHVGRSRNDEVVTCIRMALRDELVLLSLDILTLQEVLLDLAEENVDTIMPGFTHLQHAQATTLGHHLLGYYDALERDCSRVTDCFWRTNKCPLGAAAFASTGFPLDRDLTAAALGFDGLIEHSMDAVSSRDFAVDALGASSSLMLTLSRLAEELILWSSTEFGYVELDDTFTSTSSIMPQKKNPDTLEMMRARSGSVIGSLVAVLSILKALPYSYNLDLQEVTPHLRQGMRNSTESARIAIGIMRTVTINKERLADMSTRGFTAATELADTIVRVTHVPFRTAHNLVGALARSGDHNLSAIDDIAIKQVGQSLSSLGLSQKDVNDALDVHKNVEKRSVKGGPAMQEVQRMIKSRRQQLQHKRRNVRKQKKALEKAEMDLLRISGV
ncbi:MAG: argininosuccinate lyase [Euryarchaeota archaeon]|nr:argininosuccinate lyase [Euryarchaeota archaeon]